MLLKKIKRRGRKGVAWLVTVVAWWCVMVELL
jgi:hypothetical protein